MLIADKTDRFIDGMPKLSRTAPYEPEPVAYTSQWPPSRGPPSSIPSMMPENFAFVPGYAAAFGSSSLPSTDGLPSHTDTRYYPHFQLPGLGAHDVIGPSPQPIIQTDESSSVPQLPRPSFSQGRVNLEQYQQRAYPVLPRPAEISAQRASSPAGDDQMTASVQNPYSAQNSSKSDEREEGELSDERESDAQGDDVAPGAQKLARSLAQAQRMPNSLSNASILQARNDALAMRGVDSGAARTVPQSVPPKAGTGPRKLVANSQGMTGEVLDSPLR